MAHKDWLKFVNIWSMRTRKHADKGCIAFLNSFRRSKHMLLHLPIVPLRKNGVSNGQRGMQPEPTHIQHLSQHSPTPECRQCLLPFLHTSNLLLCANGPCLNSLLENLLSDNCRPRRLKRRPRSISANTQMPIRMVTHSQLQHSVKPHLLLTTAQAQKMSLQPSSADCTVGEKTSVLRAGIKLRRLTDRTGKMGAMIKVTGLVRMIGIGETRINMVQTRVIGTCRTGVGMTGVHKTWTDMRGVAAGMTATYMMNRADTVLIEGVTISMPVKGTGMTVLVPVHQEGDIESFARFVLFVSSSCH